MTPVQQKKVEKAEILKFLATINNGEVLMITNMHTGMESVERERKRPRITNINKRNVLAIWGNDPVKKMEIPAVIDDYNHFMGGVDKADHLIQSYRPGRH